MTYNGLMSNNMYAQNVLTPPPRPFVLLSRGQGGFFPAIRQSGACEAKLVGQPDLTQRITTSNQLKGRSISGTETSADL